MNEIFYCLLFGCLSFKAFCFINKRPMKTKHLFTCRKKKDIGRGQTTNLLLSHTCPTSLEPLMSATNVWLVSIFSHAAFGNRLDA